MVVPDSSSAQKVPAIDGLLEYRKDKQELYVRSNETWNVLAKEDKIQQEMDKRYNSNLEKNKKLEQKVCNVKKIASRFINTREGYMFFFHISYFISYFIKILLQVLLLYDIHEM